MTYNLNGGFKPTMKRFADLDGPDYFPTPAWATHALADNEQFDGDIWESACGNGAMSDVLELYGNRVASSDLALYLPFGRSQQMSDSASHWDLLNAGV